MQKTVEPEKGIINAKLGTKVFIRLHITFYLFICFPMNWVTTDSNNW